MFELFQLSLLYNLATIFQLYSFDYLEHTAGFEYDLPVTSVIPVNEAMCGVAKSTRFGVRQVWILPLIHYSPWARHQLF